MVHDLFSLRMQDRLNAVKIAHNHLIGIKRKNAVPFFVTVLATNPKMPPTNGNKYGDAAIMSPKRLALRIMAEWSDEKLIELFMSHIVYYSPPLLSDGIVPSSLYSVSEYAAVRGLINIGMPSIGPCVKELAKEVEFKKYREYNRFDDYPEKLQEVRTTNLLYVIWAMIGYREMLSILNSEIEKISKINPSGADKIAKAIEKMKAYESLLKTIK